MPRYRVAHINEQGQDMIIVPLESSFGRQITSDQEATIAELQIRANSAGLAGTVVPVWDGGGGRMYFIAPGPWRGFFENINLQWVAMNLNKEIYW
jgi:hypothetical protein